MSRFIGFCYDTGAWGGDLTGVLIREEEGGWVDVAGHISSNESWSRADIQRHYDRRDDASPDDTFEWVGLLKTQAELDAYPPKAVPA